MEIGLSAWGMGKRKDIFYGNSTIASMIEQKISRIKISPAEGENKTDTVSSGENFNLHNIITVELLITDPPRSDHPLYNGQSLWNGLNLP